MSILMIVVNNTLGIYGGDIYISAFGVINRLIMFVLMPLFGVVQGFQPITGYNYGAGKPDRVKATVKISMISLVLFGTCASVLLATMPGFFISLFSRDPALIDTARRILRIIVLMFPLLGVQIIGAGFFQAIGKPIPSLILGMSRQYLLLIPLVIVMPLFFGIDGIIASFPLADFLATAITAGWLLREMKRLHLIGAVEEAPA
jgi:Na+-driven multidrug efflux pump